MARLLGLHCNSYKALRSARQLSSTRVSKPLTLTDGVHASSPIFLDASALEDPIVQSSPAPFLFYPAFLSLEEQSILLRGSLAKLDASLTSSREVRENRKAWRQAGASRTQLCLQPHQSRIHEDENFLPEGLYDFDEGHYDGVIHGYREMHVTSWPSDSSVGGQPPLSSIVARLKELFLSNLILASPLSVFSKSQNIDIQMHLLHLRGAILPHIDNLDASGSMIMGVSLGSPRVMRMVRRDTRQSDSLRAFEILLLPGSVYIQRDALRYNFEHSIAADDVFRGVRVPRGQRLSIVMRDMKLLA